MKKNGDKLRIEDLTEKDFAAAREIVHAVVASQSQPANTLGIYWLAQIVKGYWKGGAGLRAGLRAGLAAGLDAGLHAGLHDGLDAGLHAGLHDGLRAGTRLCYCGIWWSWWLCRYLIAEKWGCKFDARKLALLRAYCLLCPIIGKTKDDKPVILPKPHTIRWNQAGTTEAPFSIPVYELHGNGQPSVEHALCKPLYHWHNTSIPERMGKVNSEHWEPKWLLDEKNAEIRRILIAELGYERVLHTLGGEVRDKWREYELVSLTVPDMPVRYQLLKMTCPSTGDVHILRAPPDCDTAEQAITWCNHGIHPDLFEWQA